MVFVCLGVVVLFWWFDGWGVLGGLGVLGVYCLVWLVLGGVGCGCGLLLMRLLFGFWM